MKKMMTWAMAVTMGALVSSASLADDGTKGAGDKNEKTDKGAGDKNEKTDKGAGDKNEKTDKGAGDKNEQAKARETVSCDEGAFAEKIESGKPVGDASGIASSRRATYFVVCKNAGEATQVTLVWKLDGKEAQRQTLDIGHSSRWKTWGSRPLGDAKLVEVELLESGGSSLKTDKLELP